MSITAVVKPATDLTSIIPVAFSKVPDDAMEYARAIATAPDFRTEDALYAALVYLAQNGLKSASSRQALKLTGGRCFGFVPFPKQPFASYNVAKLAKVEATIAAAQ